MKIEKYNRWNPIKLEIIQEIINFYLKGKKLEEISEIYGICEESVRNILNKNNILRRTHSESCKRYSMDETFFEKIDTEEKAYILGLMYSDGNINRRGDKKLRGFELALSGDGELKLLQKIKDIIKFD